MTRGYDRMVNLDVDLVRAFVTIAETGSATHAAERLGRTQPAVSMQIKRLEERLDVQLFVRTPRRLALTAEGESILPAALRLLRANDEMVCGARADELDGEVRLGAPEEFAAIHLAPVLAEFTRAHPNVGVTVCCDLSVQLLERFRAGMLDLVLVKREAQSALDGEVAWREPLVWLGADGAVPVKNGAVNLCVRPSPCLLRKRAIRVLEDAGRKVRVTYTSPSLMGLHAAVRAGIGLTVLPLETAPPDLAILQDGLLPPLGAVEMTLLKSSAALPRAAEVLAAGILRALREQAGADRRAA
jgi:DNA-binding transcriptional LysR family regulator